MKMKIAKILLIACFCFALPVYAGEYTPLVQIPGLGATVTISSYLVGIYNFFLSIVGIVAVLMLILGGMRYISAAGNSSAIGDAKSMIESAIFGLLLALASWLFVSTINPDILYVRQPGLTSSETINANSITFVSSASTDCIAPGSSNGTDGTVIENCICADFSELPYTEGSTCNSICSSEKKCGNKFLAIKLNISDKPDNGLYNVNEIWQLFLINDGVYDEFNITADHYLGSSVTNPEDYNCAILVTHESAANDENHVFWVRSGATIKSSALSIYSSFVDRDIVFCEESRIGDHDCAFRWTAGVELFSGMAVLQARFTDNVSNRCGDEDRNCELAVWRTNGPVYRLNKDVIKCVDGYWK